MKTLLVATILGWLAIPALAQPFVATQEQAMQQAIYQIQAARAVPAAVDAYARGMEIDGRYPSLYRTYVQKMVELGSPEMSYNAAQFLVGIQPDSPLAWAVIAHMRAGQDNLPQALPAIAYAAEKMPESVFVQDVAGQLLAWYDSEPQRPEIALSVRQSMERVRQAMAGRPMFDASYARVESFLLTEPGYAPAPAEVVQPPPVAYNTIIIERRSVLSPFGFPHVIVKHPRHHHPSPRPPGFRVEPQRRFDQSGRLIVPTPPPTMQIFPQRFPDPTARGGSVIVRQDDHRGRRSGSDDFFRGPMVRQDDSRGRGRGSDDFFRGPMVRQDDSFGRSGSGRGRGSD